VLPVVVVAVVLPVAGVVVVKSCEDRILLLSMISPSGL